MALDSLIYAVIQAIHNLSAAVALGAPLFGLWYGLDRVDPRRVLWLLLGVWVVQVLTGTAFGAASIWAYGALPDLHPIATRALGVKIACAGAAVGLCAWRLARASPAARPSWVSLSLLAAVAISAAAVLRWFS